MRQRKSEAKKGRLAQGCIDEILPRLDSGQTKSVYPAPPEIQTGVLIYPAPDKPRWTEPPLKWLRVWAAPARWLSCRAPLGNVMLRRCFGRRFCAGRDGWNGWVQRFRNLWVAAMGRAASQAGSEPAVTAYLGLGGRHGVAGNGGCGGVGRALAGLTAMAEIEPGQVSLSIGKWETFHQIRGGSSLTGQADARGSRARTPALGVRRRMPCSR